MADFISGRSQSTVTSSAGKSFISTLIARLPFSYQIIDNITKLNPKYEIFQDLTSDRAVRINQQSVFRTDMENEVGLGSVLVDKNFQKFMYANLDLDKIKRLQDYRVMSSYSLLSDCLDEICNELFVEDEKNRIATLKLNADFSKIIEEEINKEWQKFIDIYNLREKGWEYTRSFIIDGEIFFENIISETHPEYGVIGVVQIPTELINPFYKNVQNDNIEGYALRKPVINKNTERMDKEELIVFQKNQVTYIHSGRWNEDRTIRLPYIENARRAYKQLSLIEDSIVIYRLVRAPERLAFHVDVGNMTPPKAESYIKRLMQQYWAKKTYDTTTGRITNVYDPQSMLDSYWFPKRAGTEGTRIEQLQGGQNLGQLDDLMYFLKQLYRSMKIPQGRLASDDVYKDGTDMTREELKFAKHLMHIQKQFAKGIKESFIAHLKLRKIWESYKIKERNIEVVFNVPTMFMLMKQQQIFNLKYENFNNLSNNEGVSNSYAQKHFLGLSDEEMSENREWRRKDAALQYELEQILNNGPGWKSQFQRVQSATNQMGLGSAPTGGSGAAPTGEATTPPDFGPAPATGEAPPPAGDNKQPTEPSEPAENTAPAQNAPTFGGGQK